MNQQVTIEELENNTSQTPQSSPTNPLYYGGMSDIDSEPEDTQKESDRANGRDVRDGVIGAAAADADEDEEGDDKDDIGCDEDGDDDFVDESQDEDDGK